MSTFTMKLEGMAELEREIEKRLKEIGGPMTEKFLTVALGEVSAHTAPYVPVGETSNLINSEWRRVYEVSSGWSGEIGFNATTEDGTDYALITHEGGPKNWQKGGASDKYLEKGLEDFIRDSLDATIKAVYK
jgi:hypothetical protein